jgi:hypothetical protein
MSARRPHAPDETVALLRRAGPILGDDDWWGYVVDGSTAKSPEIARLALDLGARVSRWAIARQAGDPSPLVELSDVEPLLRSGLVHAVRAGARCAKHIAAMMPDGADRFLDLFRRAPTNARAEMTWYSDPRDDAIAQRFLGEALRDRSHTVRQSAAHRAASRDLKNLLSAINGLLPNERDPGRLEHLRKCASHLEKGYWLGPEDQMGLREYSVIDRGPASIGWTETSVPAATVEALGEREVAARMRRTLTPPVSKADEEWLGREMDNWRRARGLPVIT